jgi:AcrR family transcriptional regulator
MATYKRNRSATTERILIALEHVLAEAGMQGVSVTRVAEKAGISKVLVYRYFGNLDGLLDYYVSTGRVLPTYTPVVLEQMRPTHFKDIAPYWSTNALNLINKVRASPSSRQLLMATVQENDPLSDTVSRTLDQQLTSLVNQFSFVKGSDHKAIAAVVLGGLSYLTIQAQLDHTTMGLDLRGEEGWARIEKAVELIYEALATMAIDSETIQIELKPVTTTFGIKSAVPGRFSWSATASH